MLTRFFDTTAVDSLAEAVVIELARLLPVDLAATSAKAGIRARELAESKVRKRVDAFAATRRLNVYQKAKLGTQIENRLQSSGYPADFSKAFAFDVVRTLAIAAANKKS